jgi:hypothetical protein
MKTLRRHEGAMVCSQIDEGEKKTKEKEGKKSFIKKTRRDKNVLRILKPKRIKCC